MSKVKKNYMIYENYFLTNDFVDSLQKDDEIIAKQLRLKKINNIGLKIIRSLFFIFDTSFQKYWFENPEILHEIEDQEINTIVLFDLGIYHVKFINQILKKAKLKLWVWNKVDSGLADKQFKYSQKKIGSIYTFDKKDAQKYEINYLEQFYWRIQDKSLTKKDSVFFIGVDKGRIEQIVKVKKMFLDTISTDFHVIPDEQKSYDTEQKELLITSVMQYDEVLKHVQNSKYLLEINKENQTGLTVRALEALFFEKKLITNNSEIQKYDFYHSSNIFILNVDTEQKEFQEFLNKEYVPISDQVKQKYFYKTWLRNILQS